MGIEEDKKAKEAEEEAERAALEEERRQLALKRQADQKHGKGKR